MKLWNKVLEYLKVLSQFISISFWICLTRCRKKKNLKQKIRDQSYNYKKWITTNFFKEYYLKNL